MSRKFLLAGLSLAFLSVALGAFGAHILKAKLEPQDMAVFQTGIQYQGFHALSLILCAAWLFFHPSSRRTVTACVLFTVGIILFSGSLYALSLTGAKWLGAVTPVGGICLLAGWVSLLAEAASLPEDPRS